MELRGQVALVTGASAGIGTAVAETLAGAGVRLLAHGRDPGRTTQLAARLGAVPLVADLSAAGRCDELAAAAEAVHGRVDVLVANAGVGWSGPFAQMPPDRLDEVLAVDLLAPLRLVRALLPGMLARGRGRLVLVGSVAGRTGVAGEAAYGAAKGGLDLFAESLRLELRGTGVRVGLVLPGAVETDFFTRRGRDYGRRVPRPVPAQRVAATVRALLEEDRDEVWVPRWLRTASVVRALAPATYRRLAARFGEDPGSGPAGGLR